MPQHTEKTNVERGFVAYHTNSRVYMSCQSKWVVLARSSGTHAVMDCAIPMARRVLEPLDKQCSTEAAIDKVIGGDFLVGCLLDIFALAESLSSSSSS
mmetsp:Transcript_11392/g.20691  ORF Transcript_11392/g.20691 Transcript_11392/m.20691 type:complete len:98 (-) Transcript_11392:1365-1658(-)